MIETLAQIKAPHFVAGIVLWRDEQGIDWVVEAAPIVKYLVSWDRQQVRSYAGQKHWTCQVVHELERERPTWWRPPRRKSSRQVAGK